jgi:DNA-binding NarL/FixJ family response regulator
MDPITILFADNQFLIREGVVASLKKAGINAIKTANSISDFLTLINDTSLQLVIIDNCFLGDKAAQKLFEIKENHPQLKFLVLTNGMNYTEIADYSHSGIFAIIMKTSDKEVFIKAIDSAMNDRIFYSNDLLDLLIEQNNLKFSNIKPYKITDAEHGIINLIVKGLTTRDIALERNISYHTVVSHKKNIFKKLGVKSSSELIVYAIQKGMVDTCLQ